MKSALLSVVLLLGLSVAAGAAQATTTHGAPTPVIAPAAAHSATGGTALCPATTSPVQARCLTLLKPASQQALLRASAPTAKAAANRAAAAAADLPAKYLGATDLQKAYGLTPALLSRGKGQTIAIVDAYAYPQAEADLAVYRSRYGLPACTKATGCLRQINQRGTTAPAPTAPLGLESWQVETALDFDMVSAACPLCSILIVESDSQGLEDLGAAVNTAVAAGASIVSNSYGTPEESGLDSFASYWTHPGVPMVISSGDSGFGTAGFPAVLPNVVAVGGTELVHATNTRGFSETAWSFAGSGCSAYFAKPSWQPGTHCSMRSTADVSAAADNIIIYNSTVAGGLAGVAGTSASAPFIAGVIGIAGNAKTYTAKYSYQHTSSLHDVIGGTSAQATKTCGTDYLCNGVKGYDGPTGVGTPNGTGGF